MSYPLPPPPAEEEVLTPLLYLYSLLAARAAAYSGWPGVPGLLPTPATVWLAAILERLKLDLRLEPRPRLPSLLCTDSLSERTK